MNPSGHRTHQDRRAPEGGGVRGPSLRRTSATLLATLLATSVLAGPDDKAAQPAQAPSPGSVQTPAPPGLYPYYLVPFFPFLWPAPPALLSQPQPYPFVIWLPFPPPAPPAPAQAQPAAPPHPEAALPEPPAPPVAVQAPPTAHTPTPAAPPEAAPPPVVAVEPPPAAAEAPQAVPPPAEPSRLGATVRKPSSAKPTASPRPTSVAKPAKRKLCWREGRLDVCK